MRKLGHFWGAATFAAALGASMVISGNCQAADADDHSYLPPWMLANAAQQPADKEIRPSASSAPESAQAAKLETKPDPAKDSPKTLDARASLVKNRVFGFVSGLIGKSWRFARGE